VYGCAPARIAFAVSDDGPIGLRKARFTFLENLASGLDLNQTHFTLFCRSFKRMNRELAK
jgi:hypothetical protein